MSSSRKRKLLRVVLDFLLPAIALWGAVHFDWLSIRRPDGTFNAEDFILKVVVAYLAGVPFVDLVIQFVLSEEPKRGLYALVSRLITGRTQQGDPSESGFPYEILSPQQLPSKLPDLSHPEIPYIHRQSDPVHKQMSTTMKNAQRLLIIGRRGLGKTKEAIELVQRLQDETGEDVTVLLPRGPLDVPLTVPRDKMKRHVVLFLDNLQELFGEPYTIDNINDPGLIEGDSRERLYESIRVFQDCLGTKFRVVATAIGLPDWRKKLRLEDKFWNSFTVIQLPDLALDKRGDLLSAMERHFHVKIAEDAKAEMTRRSDGTFSGLIVPILKERQKGTITAQEIASYKFVYPHDFEESVYRPIFAKNQHREALMTALSILQQTNMERFAGLVVPLAAHIVSIQFQWFHRLMIRRALRDVADWVPVSSAGVVKCPDAYLISKADVWKEKDALLATVSDLLRNRAQALPLRPSLHELVAYLLKHGDSFDAINIYKWLLQINPDNAASRNRLAVLYFKLGMLVEAEEECVTALRYCSHPDSWITLASICATQRQFREAASACRIALDQNQNNWFYWARLASIQDELGDCQGAVHSARNAVHLQKLSPFAHICLAVAHEQAGQFDRAIRQGWYAIALDPDNATAWQTLGVSYSRAGLYDEAFKAFTNATTLAGDSAKAWSLLARATEEAGRPGSLELFRKACELAPQDPNLKLSYAVSLERAGNFAESEKVINEVISLAPNDARAHAALKRARSFKPAINDEGAVCEHNPHTLSELGKQHFAAGKFDDAAETFGTLVRNFPNWARAHQHLGASLLALNRLDEAVASLKIAVELDPKMSKAHYLLGRALALQSKYADAEAELDESIRIKPLFTPAQEELKRVLQKIHGDGADPSADQR